MLKLFFFFFQQEEKNVYKSNNNLPSFYKRNKILRDFRDLGDCQAPFQAMI